MPDTLSLIGFMTAALILLITPGPGVLYVVTRSVSQGRRAGLISVLGLALGVFVHIAAAAIGLSTILLTSAVAFNIVKILGAGYLIYLGLRTLFSRQSSSVAVSKPPTSHRLFVDGVLVSILNPKIALFFLAFLPQFVNPGMGSASIQIIVLGLIYVGLAIITDGCYALLASSLRNWVNTKILEGPVARYVSGGIYLGLGISTAVSGHRN